MAKLNLYYALTVVIIACGSIPKGYEGGFAAASGLESFLADFHLTHGARWGGASSATQLASRRAVVTSLGVLGAAVGAVIACAVTDRVGRLRAWQGFAALWMTGFLAATLASGSLGLLLAARVWGGVGAGGLTVVAPLYLAEVARAPSRGMFVSVYMVILLSFLMAGFFNYAVVRTMPPTRSQYRVVLAVPQIPVGLVLIGSLFLSDTPRWLASKERGTEALAALVRLRGSHARDPEVLREFAEMQRQVDDERQVLAGASTWAIVKEVATVASYRRRFLLGVMMQTVAQWSGGNGITYYIPEIFRLAGVSTKRHSLVTAGSYGAAKLVFTWGLIDYFGRRRCFMAGLALQCITHVYIAVYMGLWREARDAAASAVSVASVFVYAVGWSIGLCTVQYTCTAPRSCRRACAACATPPTWPSTGCSSSPSCASRPPCSAASTSGAPTCSGPASAPSASSSSACGRPRPRACPWSAWPSCSSGRGTWAGAPSCRPRRPRGPEPPPPAAALEKGGGVVTLKGE